MEIARSFYNFNKGDNNPYKQLLKSRELLKYEIVNIITCCAGLWVLI